MVKNYALAVLLCALALSVACATARRTGSTVKDATVATGQAIGDKTSDATITSAIKMKFAADKTVDALDINVDTSDGNVTLTGKVRAQTEADQALTLARSVEGVKTVTPHLTISNE
jgi:hyperosmotically inducible periplasmic protein